jgi:hypothetical protein
VARVAGLRDEVASLNSLRQELGQLAELRADMGQLRADLTEQLSSEMLVERIVMRTQASRFPADQGRLDGAGRALDGASSWADDVPPRELTGGWPAVRLDEPRETQQFEQMRVERAGPRPPVPAPATAAWHAPARPQPAAEPQPWDAPLPTPPWEAPSWETPAWETPATGARPPAPEPVVAPTSTFATAPPRVFTPPTSRDEPAEGPQLKSSIARHEEGSSPTRHAMHESAAAPPTSSFPLSPPPVGTPPSAAEWLAARGPQTSPSQRPVPHRRRRDDDGLPDPGDPAAAPTLQRPAVPSTPVLGIEDRGGYRIAVREDPRLEPPAPDNRLAEILAENDVSPSAGGRRRRRYRDEDEPDDVLARVLRGN